MDLPNGTKRITGLVIMGLSVILPYFGFGLSEAAPVEMARFADGIGALIGMGVLLYGEYHAKAPLWVKKKD